MTRDWWAPLTGVAFVALLIVAFVVAGEPPDADEGAQKILAFYDDDRIRVLVGAGLSAIAASLFVWFGATFRDALRNADAGHDGIAPNIVFAGTIITAVGAGIDATILIAITEAVDSKVDNTAVVALQALWDNDFVPIAIGLQLFLLGSGLALLRRALLPKWMGWIAVVLGVVGLTPVGFIAYLVGGVWLIAASIMLTLRNRRAQPPVATSPAAEPLAQPVGVTR